MEDLVEVAGGRGNGGEVSDGGRRIRTYFQSWALAGFLNAHSKLKGLRAR